ncbi:hypothetical protein [Inhella crocodyli]|uniref:Uncharacterized protein n=1 Tax=Inhella crocodyli TaxID=2499851 RepID=A0A437LEM4_9BURK|nr:hypothetical protein [Inhella crocodyli]RVT83798.1 hypothetical protein EOD73_14635 [Inhella crocodyli]
MTASALHRIPSPNPQLELSLVAPEPLAPEALAHGGSDAEGWQLGHDHAKHGLPLPAAHLHEGSPLFAGWQAALAKAANTRHRDPAPGVRPWLALRLQAWQEGVAFESTLLTPHYLRQLDTSHCPVTRAPLHDETGHAQQRTWVRLRQDARYAAGHLACLSRRAAQALAGRNAAQLRAIAERVAATGAAEQGLHAAEWARLAALVALVTPGGTPDALPVLPPNRLRLLNPLQALQAWIGRQLGENGWAQRLHALHDALPNVSARQAATALTAALAPHALALPTETLARQHALEDLWLDARVQRRWLQLAGWVSPLTAERLLTQLPQPQGYWVEQHAAQAATEAWAA